LFNHFYTFGLTETCFRSHYGTCTPLSHFYTFHLTETCFKSHYGICTPLSQLYTSGLTETCFKSHYGTCTPLSFPAHSFKNTNYRLFQMNSHFQVELQPALCSSLCVLQASDSESSKMYEFLHKKTLWSLLSDYIRVM
jgi:hypothetical protein